MANNPLKGIRRFNEVNFVVTKLQNKLRKKEILLPKEIDKLCEGLSPPEKDTAIKMVQRLGNTYKERIIHFNDDSLGNETIKEKDILSYLIRPEYVNTEKDHIQIGAQFYTGLRASGFPATVMKNWLGRLAEEKGNMDFSLHIQPGSVRALEVYLNMQLKQVENDLYKYTSKGLNNPSLENRKTELLEQLNSLIRGDYKLYRMSLYIASKGGSVIDSARVNKKVFSTLNSEGIEADPAIHYQEKLMRSLIPAGTDYLPDSQIMVPGPAASASFPFSSSYYDPDEEEGILLGFNNNNIPLVKSMWKLPKYIGAVLGTTGSGKSYASKAFILQDQLISGTKVFVLDPEAEYVDMAKNIPGSQVIHLHNKSKSIPNVLDLMGMDFTDKLSSLTTVFNVLLDGVSDIQKPLIEDCLLETYKKKGIRGDNKNTWKKKAPKLSDLYKVMAKRKMKVKDDGMKANYEIIMAKLGRYTHGIFKFIDQSGEIYTNSDFVVFEFKEMTEEIRPVLMLVLLEFIKTKFNLDNGRKMLVLDEAWRMLKSKYEAEYVEAFARTFRKRHGALLMITQSVEELKESPDGKAVLANTSFRYILDTERSVLDETFKLFGLNESEKALISTGKRGHGVLIWGDKHYETNIHVDPETDKLISTNREESGRAKKK